jgi:hypothetical protein
MDKITKKISFKEIATPKFKGFLSAKAKQILSGLSTPALGKEMSQASRRSMPYKKVKLKTK